MRKAIGCLVVAFVILGLVLVSAIRAIGVGSGIGGYTSFDSYVPGLVFLLIVVGFIILVRK